ncbi:MAG: hypothetical protein GYA24_07300 [Candidatus Lokiarchaeota archaeon]|nr:hypothetical protein [Candidatus Lokiarchaeota archaeon]
MSEQDKEHSKIPSGLGFIDQIVDGIRKIGESVQIQGIMDDAFYLASKYAMQFLLGAAAKFKIEGKVDVTANRGAIFTVLASGPADILLMSQIASKKMAFVVNKEQSEAPILKSILKAFGIIADVDEMINDEKDTEIYQWIRADRKVLTIAVDDNTEPAKIEKVYEKVLKLARDGFCPIIPIGISGTSNLKPGAEIIMRIGEKFGVNQNVKDQDIGAMAKDLIEKLHFLRA